MSISAILSSIALFLVEKLTNLFLSVGIITVIAVRTLSLISHSIAGFNQLNIMAEWTILVIVVLAFICMQKFFANSISGYPLTLLSLPLNMRINKLRVKYL